MKTIDTKILLGDCKEILKTNIKFYKNNYKQRIHNNI